MKVKASYGLEGYTQAWLDAQGPWGPVVFVGAFVLGSLIGLPGMAFVIGGRLAFGPYLGFVVGFGGGMLAVPRGRAG